MTDPSNDPEIDQIDETSSNPNPNDSKDNKEDDELDLPENPTETTPQQQRILMKKLGIKVQQTGDVWYPIDKKWYDSWERYTMFDKGDDDIPGGIDQLHDIGEPRPGKIDNSNLADPENPKALKRDIQENRTHIWIHEDIWKLLHSWYTGGPEFPRKVYERGGTYSKEKYICIFPQLVKLVYCDDETGAIDCDKFTVKGFPPDYTLKEMAKDLEDEMEWKEDDNKKDDTPYVHIWLKLGQVKAIYPIDKQKAKVTEEELAKEDMERWVEVPDDYLKTKLDDIALSQQQEQEKEEEDAGADATANDATTNANATETDVEDKKEQTEETKTQAPQPPKAKDFLIVIEKKQSDDKWPRAKGDDWRETLQTGDIIDVKDEQDKWYESLVRYVYPSDHSEKAGKCIVHYIGWNIKWDEPLDVSDTNRLDQRHANTSGPHRPRKKEHGGGYGGGGYYDSSFSFWQNENGAPEQRGVVGLRNLGNTCFMNSTIQCLAQSPQLTNYFLNNDYMHHVNKNNPLGWGGRVAKAWAVLLHDMFSGKYRVVAPRQFKSAIGEVAPRFMGYAQQDSQELLSFVLDGLHEDLNQIEKKPTTDAVESAGRPDDVVAMEAWRTYLRRNQSIIVDLLQGQYKSKVVCPDCGRISITFDPYMFLSVPLPTEKYKIIQYTFVNNDTSMPPTVYGIKMLKMADIQMLKESVAKKHQVDKDELFVCDIWKSKIHRELRRHDSVGDINRKSDDIFIYHSKRPNLDDWKQAKTAGDEDAAENEEAVAGAEEEAAAAPNKAEEVEDERRGGGGGGGGVGRAYGGGGYGGGGYGGDRRGGKNQDFQTFVVNNQHRVMSRPQYAMHGGQQRFEDEPIGYPLLVTLPMKIPVTYKQIRLKLWQLIQPFLHDENLKITDEGLPFELWAAWGFNTHAKILDNDDVFDLNERNLKFLVHWKDTKQYKSELYDMENRPRDESAPAPVDHNSMGLDDDDTIGGGRHGRGRGKPIELAACINAFCEKETLSENDAWYCSQCKDFKCASKKIDLWGSPDLLIIHLKRFSYTRNWRDRINTLVKFPIEGLDLSPFLLSKPHKADAIYDLYAVSNHMGGMGGGHYTAYAKNLDNQEWFHLDDSRTSKVGNTQQIVSSSAYVLYYYKRNPRKLKHRASRVVIPEFDKDAEDDANALHQ